MLPTFDPCFYVLPSFLTSLYIHHFSLLCNFRGFGSRSFASRTYKVVPKYYGSGLECLKVWPQWSSLTECELPSHLFSYRSGLRVAVDFLAYLYPLHVSLCLLLINLAWLKIYFTLRTAVFVTSLSFSYLFVRFREDKILMRWGETTNFPKDPSRPKAPKIPPKSRTPHSAVLKGNPSQNLSIISNLSQVSP